MKILLYSVMGAWLVTFGLFSFMAILLPKEKRFVAVDEPTFMTLKMVYAKDKQKQNDQILKPSEPPKVTSLAPTIINSYESEYPEQELISFEWDHRIDTTFKIEEIKLINEYVQSAQPIHRTLPRYPIQAALNKVEGWVKIVFEVDSDGKVVNPQVLDSQPTNVFDQSALEAIKNWRYKPQLNQGEALPQKDLLVKINFNL